MQLVNAHDLVRLKKAGRICGINTEALLSEVGVIVSNGVCPDALWDGDALGRLYSVALSFSKKSHFPFALGEHFLLDRAPEIEVFIATISRVREVFTLLGFLPYLFQPDTLFWHEEDDDSFRLYVDMQRDGQRLDIAGHIETIFVLVQRLLQKTAVNADIAGISFRHEPLTSAYRYKKQFGFRPKFGARSNWISFSKEIVDSPLESSSPELNAQAQLLLEGRIRRQKARISLVRIIEMIVMQSPAANQIEVCRRLGLNQQGLMQELSEEGVSFDSLHVRARLQMAKVFISSHDFDIEFLAHKLGFSSENSFTKEFSAWAGVPPNHIR